MQNDSSREESHPLTRPARPSLDSIQVGPDRSADNYNHGEERASLLPPGSPEAHIPNTLSADEPIDWIMASLLFVFPALGGLLFGFDIGATSGALLSMADARLSGTDWYSLSAFQSGLVVSSSLGGALLGSAAAFVYGDKLGRKKELLLASGLYCESILPETLSWR